MDNFWILLTETQLVKTLLVVLFFVAAILILISYIIAIIQGREISYWPPKIGVKPPKTVIKPISSTVAETKPIEINVDQRISELEKQLSNFAKEKETPGVVFKPRPLPERVRYLLDVKMHFDSKIKSVVLSHGGAWAGASIASIDTYLEYLRMLESEDRRINLTHDISELYSVLREYLEEYTCSPTLDINDTIFLYIQYMASQLERKFGHIRPTTIRITH